MNIIEAWKKANVGDSIVTGNKMRKIFKPYDYNSSSGSKYYSALLNHIKNSFADDSYLVSDDWEIERKPMVFEGTVIWHREANQGNPDIAVPYGYHGCENRAELMKFIGKRTRIRIEEIIE